MAIIQGKIKLEGKAEEGLKLKTAPIIPNDAIIWDGGIIPIDGLFSNPWRAQRSDAAIEMGQNRGQARHWRSEVSHW